MRPSRVFQFSLVIAGAMSVAGSSCGRSGTSIPHDGAARLDAPASNGGHTGGGFVGNDSSIGIGFGGAFASGGSAGTTSGGTGGSGGTVTAASGAAATGDADALAAGGAGGTPVGGSGGTASGGGASIATGGAGGAKTGGSVGVGGSVTGGIGSAGSGGTATGAGGSAHGGSTGSGGTQPEPLVDSGIDSGALDLGTALSGKTLIYWATSKQQPPDGGFLSRTPSDQDFVGIAPVAEDVLVFSSDASTVQMTAIQGAGVPRTGTRTTTDQGNWTYRLTPGTGGQLVVWLSGDTILAAKTLYGSGLPVTESTRGELRSN